MKKRELTEEEIQRKNTLKTRMFWILVAINALLAIYIIFQFVTLFSK